MNSRLLSLLVLLFCLGSYHSRSQTDQVDEARDEYNQAYSSAEELVSSFLYADALEEYQRAIEIAKSNDLEEERINAQISLAELLRKTRDFDPAYRLITSISGSENYPYLQVRLYGRLAAIYHEKSFPENISPYDSVYRYLQLAIPIAEKEGFEVEEAALKNELGQWLYTRTDPKEAEPHLLRSSQIFKKYEDTANYVNVMGNLIDCFYDQGRKELGDSLAFYVLDMIASDKWISLRPRIYDLFSEQSRLVGDSLNYYRWEKISLQGKLHYVQTLKEKQLSKLLVMNETQRLMEEKERAEKRVQEEEERQRTLFYILAILAVSALVVMALLFRENRLRLELKSTIGQLNEANERYQMLMVESNHRIKNNLQMITSMLQFANKDLTKSKEVALSAISNKIHTISALHKHLYLDIHNPKVKLEDYFLDIVSSYLEMDKESLKVHTHFEPLEIKSERIVYFGLVLNELLSNTLEHNKTGLRIVELSITKRNEAYLFSYNDGSKRTKGDTDNTGLLLIKQLIHRVKGRDYQLAEDVYHYQFEFDA